MGRRIGEDGLGLVFRTVLVIEGRYANSTAVPVVKTPGPKNGSQSDRRTLQRSGWEVAPLVDQWQWKPPKSVDFKHGNRNAAM